MVSYMKTITRPVPSVASAAKERVLSAPAGTFLGRKDFAGTDRAVETALSRLFAKGELGPFPTRTGNRRNHAEGARGGGQ